MQVTLTLDDVLLAMAEEYTGISDKSALIRAALRVLVLVERAAARRLARLGGSQPDLKPIPRRCGVLRRSGVPPSSAADCAGL